MGARHCCQLFQKEKNIVNDQCFIFASSLILFGIFDPLRSAFVPFGPLGSSSICFSPRWSYLALFGQFFAQNQPLKDITHLNWSNIDGIFPCLSFFPKLLSWDFSKNIEGRARIVHRSMGRSSLFSISTIWFLWSVSPLSKGLISIFFC